MSLQEFFDLKCMLNNINVHLCCRSESGVKQLLALVTEPGDIVLHYIYGELSPVIKHLTWFNDSSKKIQAICFDPTSTWLLVAALDSSLYIVPVLNLVDKKQKIDCKWSLTDLTQFSKPTQISNSKPLSLVWWQTLDSNQNALVGYQDGTIALISLTDGRCLGTCNVGDSIIKLHLCQAINLDCVSLLINGKNGNQWRLTLEQHSTGYIWPPELNTNTDNTTTSRLLNLKRLGPKKLVKLKERFSETKMLKRDSQSSDSLSESSNSESPHSGPELLPLCDTFFTPQYTGNQYLFSAYYKPTAILRVYAVDIESAPHSIYKLCPKLSYLLLTKNLIFAINEDHDGLLVISTKLSCVYWDEEQEFYPTSVLAEYNFLENEKILNIYKLTDTTFLFDDSNNKPSKVSKEGELLKSIEQLKLQKPKVDTCVVVTNRGVYKVTISCSPIMSVNFVMDEFNFEKVERFAKTIDLNLQSWFENGGDLLISEGFYSRGLILYKQAKVHLLKRVLKLAVAADTRALLRSVEFCLRARKMETSTATKIHMGNLAVMAYTELILRYSGVTRVTTTKDFTHFLRLEEYYDQVLAVNVACQSGHWNIVTLLAKSRGLQPETVAALSQLLATSCGDTSKFDFLLTISEPSLTQSQLIYSSFGQNILQFIRENLDTFPIEILQRLILQLDPSQPCAIPIMRQLFIKRKHSTSADSSFETNEWDGFCNSNIVGKDLVETFTWVLIELISKTSEERYNIDLVHQVEISNVEQRISSINKFPRLEPLSCGYEHAAIIRNGALFTMGIATSGCLGCGPVLSDSSPPKLVNTFSELKVNVLSVSCGKKHCLALTDCGVYSWGSNIYGQLGISLFTCQSPYPQVIDSLSDVSIIKVAAGQYHSMALDSDGKVYTWGWGIYGQLGHRSCNNEQFPKLLEFEHPVTDVAAGHAHSLILTSEGKLYGCGSNAFGQLETATVSGNKSTTPIWIPVLPDIYSPIKKMSTAYFHNVVVKDDNVYIWGASPQDVYHQLHQSKHEQKLTSETTKAMEPWKISTQLCSLNPKDTVEQIAVSLRHTVLLINGQLYVCKNVEDRIIPFKASNSVGHFFQHVSCGLDFIIAMNQAGKLLAWGNNAMEQTLLGKRHREETKHKDGKVFISKNTKRAIKLEQNCWNTNPIMISGLPSMAIAYSSSDSYLFDKTSLPTSIISVENSLRTTNSKPLVNGGASPLEQMKQIPSQSYGQKTLHYVLEQYSGHYDIENVLSRCLKVNNLQAASKIAFLNEHYGDSLGFQLQALKELIDTQNLDFTIQNSLSVDIYDTCDIKHLQAIERNTYVSSSSSLDSIQQWNDDFEDQGGCESLCIISESGDIRQSMTQFVQSIKHDSPISTVSKLISENPYKNLKNKMLDLEDLLQQMNDSKARNIVNLGSQLIEFYIKQTYTLENHILMQNILLKCVEFWLTNNLPVPILEHILLKNMDKYFYPLSILLFCKNYNGALCEDIVKDECVKQPRPSRFLKEFSTKFCLQLCSMVLENVNKA
ncbi:hypothetical protein FQA39_LY02613 [Lamprigera yunnana]|nr:hypothetical protein FQA39_LY02613 [Lamprigera yunnana]